MNKYLDKLVNSLQDTPFKVKSFPKGTIANRQSDFVLDNREHFSALSVEQAQSSMNRVMKLTEVPVWFNGSIDQLRYSVYAGIRVIHPNLKLNVAVPIDKIMALSDGQTPSDTSESDVKNPANVAKKKVPQVNRPNLKDIATRTAMASALIDNLKRRQDDLQKAVNLANSLTEDGLNSEMFGKLPDFIQQDILSSLLVNNVTASEDRRQELIKKLNNAGN